MGDKRLSNTKQQTTQLVETLKKTEKQQNKFALWRGQFTNRRKTKKELQQEEEEPKTFKRRGPRPKKTTTVTDSTTTTNNNNKSSNDANGKDDETNPFITGVSATALNNVVDKS